MRTLSLFLQRHCHLMFNVEVHFPHSISQHIKQCATEFTSSCFENHRTLVRCEPGDDQTLGLIFSHPNIVFQPYYCPRLMWFLWGHVLAHFRLKELTPLFRVSKAFRSSCLLLRFFVLSNFRRFDRGWHSRTSQTQFDSRCVRFCDK